MKRTSDMKDKLDVLVLKGQREERLDKSSGGKVIRDVSVCGSDFEVIGGNFHERSQEEGGESRGEMRAKYNKAESKEERRQSRLTV